MSSSDAYLGLADPAAPGVRQPHEHARAGAHVSSLEQYRQLYQRSIDDPESFWTEIAEQFHWETRWHTFHTYNYDRTKGKVDVQYFAGGKTNMCYNALDRHVNAGRGDKVAFHW